jgi:hypothetical protein
MLVLNYHHPNSVETNLDAAPKSARASPGGLQ